MKKIRLWELNLDALADGPVMVETTSGRLICVRRRPWVGRDKYNPKPRYETSIGDFHTMSQMTRELAKE